MASRNERPLLRGRIERQEYYQSPRTPRSDPLRLPPRNAAKHRQRLLAEIAAIGEAIGSRARDPQAHRVIIAAIPAPEHELEMGKLGDKRSDARVVGEDPHSGVVVIDAADPSLPHLRQKIEAFASGARSESGERRSARLVAVLEHLRLADHHELAGPEARVLEPNDEVKYWFELGCRGGRRNTSETARTREQMRRQFKASDVQIEDFDEFEATEEVMFFIRASVRQVRMVIERVDCVFEYELAPPDIRDWLISQHTSARQIARFNLGPPPADAPAVALLDTGVASQHPLLRAALRHAVSVVPADSSPIDTHGHGTELAGVALYADLGASLLAGEHAATHWIESARLLVAPEQGSASSERRSYWPALTERAVTEIEAAQPGVCRAFCMAVTARLMQPRATTWSHALDQLAYNQGHGRLLCVSTGNADVNDRVLLDGYPTLNLQQCTHDPAQAANVLTVGAYTRKTSLPPEPIYANLTALAPAAGISPHTSAGTLDGVGWPDIVTEGGNLAYDGQFPNTGIESLSALTTGRAHVRRPLTWTWGTSEATAHAARLAASVWRENSDLRPATVRGLLVHSASWTSAMVEQFPNIDERMRICGYGVPDEAFARACVAERMTVIVEDEMPNSVIETVARKKPPKRATTSAVEDKLRRVAKFFKLPVPEEELLANPDERVELRVTLSYLAEPNTFRRRVSYGLHLRWDMQGPVETETQFRERINKLARSGAPARTKTKSFPWDLGINRRSRGTVQSDRWTGRAVDLAGSKLLAVVPVLGWWNRRAEFQALAQPFSLIVSIVAEGMDIYTPIQTALTLSASIEI